MRNILIFGLPRTATTALQLDLARLLAVKNLNEAFCGDAIADNVYEWTQAQQNCIMKLLTTNLCLQNTENIDFIKLINSGITDLVVTQRNNLADTCVSLYYAERIANQYHYLPTDQVKNFTFEVGQEFLTSWLVELDMYHQILNRLKQQQITYDLFDYDTYVNQQPQNILGYTVGTKKYHNYIHTNINYTDLCSNYQEVKTKIEDHVKRLQC